MHQNPAIMHRHTLSSELRHRGLHHTLTALRLRACLGWEVFRHNRWGLGILLVATAIGLIKDGPVLIELLTGLVHQVGIGLHHLAIKGGGLGKLRAVLSKAPATKLSVLSGLLLWRSRSLRVLLRLLRRRLTRKLRHLFTEVIEEVDAAAHTARRVLTPGMSFAHAAHLSRVGHDRIPDHPPPALAAWWARDPP